MQKSVSLTGVQSTMLAAFEGYNHRRIHSALGHLAPSEFAVQYRQDSEGATPDIMGAIGVNRMSRRSVSMRGDHSIPVWWCMKP